ncbi:hypothetical protein [Streptomyces filamentosus]|uniref:hypothetical protein n=1 Tax=Streptomyces filamentosus TaxID=67294 RepID=UPI003318BF71
MSLESLPVHRGLRAPYVAARTGEEDIAQELTAHLADRSRSESLVVLADLDPLLATLCVITLGGRPCRPLDPHSLPHVLGHDRTGVAEYELGTGAYVQVEVTT